MIYTLPGIRWFFFFLFLFLVILSLGQFLSFKLSWKHVFFFFFNFVYFYCSLLLPEEMLRNCDLSHHPCLQEPWSVSKARGFKNSFLFLKHLVFALVFILSHLIGTILLIMLSPLHIWRNWENTQLDIIQSDAKLFVLSTISFYLCGQLNLQNHTLTADCSLIKFSEY